MIRSTPHAHTDFVDGKSSAEQMVLSAMERGMRSLGFSEHAAQPFDFAYCLNASSERLYRREVLRLTARYGDVIRIYLGMERDAQSTADREGYHYVVGSAHYLPLGAEWIAVDGTPDGVKRLLDEASGGDPYRLASAYFKRFADYVTAYRPEIIAHFDLIRKNWARVCRCDIADRRYARAAQEALERMAESGAMLEINTGGMARGILPVPYPDLSLLSFWRDLGGRVIIGTDCHDASLIDFGLETAWALLCAAGYRSAWALNPSDGALFAEYPVPSSL